MAQGIHGRRDEETETISGRVLIAGVGFVVTSTMWALLGYFRYQDGQNVLAMVDLALVIAHIVAGYLILRQLRFAVPFGIGLAVLGLLATIPNGYFLPVVGDGVSGALLYLSRVDIARTQATR